MIKNKFLLSSHKREVKLGENAHSEELPVTIQQLTDEEQVAARIQNQYPCMHIITSSNHEDLREQMCTAEQQAVNIDTRDKRVYFTR